MGTGTPLSLFIHSDLRPRPLTPQAHIYRVWPVNGHRLQLHRAAPCLMMTAPLWKKISPEETDEFCTIRWISIDWCGIKVKRQRGISGSLKSLSFKSHFLRCFTSSWCKWQKWSKKELISSLEVIYCPLQFLVFFSVNWKRQSIKLTLGKGQYSVLFVNLPVGTYHLSDI